MLFYLSDYLATLCFALGAQKQFSAIKRAERPNVPEPESKNALVFHGGAYLFYVFIHQLCVLVFVVVCVFIG